MNIDKIITESINKVIREAYEIDNAPNGWHDWRETDEANGITPEQGKAIRMQPGNAARSKGTIPTRDFKIPSRDEWLSEYPNMSYAEYCFKVHGIKRK